jgi:hypothetical protein
MCQLYEAKYIATKVVKDYENKYLSCFVFVHFFLIVVSMQRSHILKHNVYPNRLLDCVPRLITLQHWQRQTIADVSMFCQMR